MCTVLHELVTFRQNSRNVALMQPSIQFNSVPPSSTMSCPSLATIHLSHLSFSRVKSLYLLLSLRASSDTELGVLGLIVTFPDHEGPNSAFGAG